MSEARIIRLVAVAGLQDRDTYPPVWLADFDVNAENGRGRIRGTRNRHEAMRFSNAGAAFEAWRRQSTVQPLRPDGKPNRPLTAYTIEIEPAEVLS